MFRKESTNHFKSRRVKRRKYKKRFDSYRNPLYRFLGKYGSPEKKGKFNTYKSRREKPKYLLRTHNKCGKS